MHSSTTTASVKRPAGLEGLDEITEGGLPENRATLVCGGPGAGKTTLAMEFLVRGARDHGAPGIYVAFEQTREEILPDYGARTFDVRGPLDSGLLSIVEVDLASTELVEAGGYDISGLFARLDAAIQRTGAQRVVLDSIDSLFSHSHAHDILRSEFSPNGARLYEIGTQQAAPTQRRITHE